MTITRRQPSKKPSKVNATVKQRNIFTGKVDILTDPGDDRGKVALAFHELGSQAGRLVKSNQRTIARPEKVENQVSLF